MKEEYLSYTFSHANGASLNDIKTAYDTALADIVEDNGTPIFATIYGNGGSRNITITYKKSTFNS